MRLIFNSESDMIESNMSDSNIGGRKNKSCINHIWVLNSIIHEQLASKSNNPIILQQYDYQQMFDSMSIKEACADLFDLGLKGNKLKVLYNANKQISVRINTPSGITGETTMKEVVMQGDTWASTMTSVQCDSFGKELLEENASYIFKYKGYVSFGIPGPVDDIIGVTEAGYRAQQMNAFLNVKTADKYLQFGPDKCKTMIKGSMKIKEEAWVHTELKVDNWEVTYDNADQIIERFKGKVKMEEVTEMLYLGVVLSCDGKNTKNIQYKHNKSIGTKNKS